MSEKTKLEEVLEGNGEYRHVIGVGGTPTDIQAVLDRITPFVCAQLSSEDIVAHMRKVYDETANTYASLPEHQFIPMALLEFMKLPCFHDGDRIIDLGCGPLARDTIFMSYTDKKARSLLMGKRDHVPTRSSTEVPHIGFNVIAVDGSSSVVTLAERRLRVKKWEWHDSDSYFFSSRVIHGDLHDVSSVVDKTVHGVWACASLFTHTPRPLVLPALSSIANALEEKGVLGVSYPSGKEGGYDNLRFSRTGRVKYFSRPEACMVMAEAKNAGLHLIYESYSDLDMGGGKVQKNFFATQFFQKQ